MAEWQKGLINPFTRCGLIAGAISGEVMVLLVLINIILIRNYSGTGNAATVPVLGTWNIAYPLLVIIVFEMGGIFAGRLCLRQAKRPKDSFLAGMTAGVTAGLILEVMWFSDIVSLVAHTGNANAALTSGYESVFLVIGLLIVLVVMGGILSAFGAYIYSVKTVTGNE
jgi:membrane-associated HD superfamily phosphohydrolase